jgi:hypothetical protein
MKTVLITFARREHSKVHRFAHTIDGEEDYFRSDETLSCHLIRSKSRYTICNEPVAYHPFVVATRTEFDKLAEEDRCPLCDQIMRQPIRGSNPVLGRSAR